MEDLSGKLAAKQVEILVSGSEDYPSRLADLLGNTTPPILYAIGDLDLLRLPSVGFSGSRKASPKGLDVARDSAGLLAEQGVNVVSGYANGVDITAHEGALAAGGGTTFVLAEGNLVATLYRQVPLPHFVWICEISVTAEYVSDLKVRGEILWDATRNAYEPNGWLALHYPELLILDTGSILNGPQKLENFPLSSSSPYRLFQSNLNPLMPI